jgi:CBS domain-containing protein
MTRDPMTVDPNVDTEAALRTMLQHGFRHLPVMEKGKIIGMISMRDLVAEG